MNDLNITSSKIEGTAAVTVLHLVGALDGGTEQQLVERARETYQSGIKHLLIDLSEVKVLTSAGLRAIHQIFKMCTPPEDVQRMRELKDPYKSPYVKLVCPNPEIYYVLNIAGFLQNILIFNNMEDAVASFSNGHS